MRAVLLLPALALVACGTSDRSEHDDVPDDVETERAVSDLDLDLGDVTVNRDLDGSPVETIVTRDGGVEMGVTEAVLFVRLSDQTRKEVSQEMDAEMEDQDGLGGSIARAVTGAVEAGLSMAAQVPLSEIEDLRAEGGRLVIVMADGGASPFENSNSDGEALLEQFSDADAERLVEAFDRVKE